MTDKGGMSQRHPRKRTYANTQRARAEFNKTLVRLAALAVVGFAVVPWYLGSLRIPGVAPGAQKVATKVRDAFDAHLRLSEQINARVKEAGTLAATKSTAREKTGRKP